MAVGDIVSIARVGGVVATDNPAASPNLNGAAVQIRFEAMARRHPINDPLCNPTSLVLTVADPGFDLVGGVITAVTRTRTIRGTLPVKAPFPQAWTAATAVPSRSFRSNNATSNRAYFCETGGTTGGTMPPGTVDNGTSSDGALNWVLMPITALTGCIESVVDSDVVVTVMLDDYLHPNSVITAWSIDAGAYQANGVSSRAGSGSTVSGASTLPYPTPGVVCISPPHRLFQGAAAASVDPEYAVVDAAGRFSTIGQMIAGARFRAITSAGSALTDWQSVTQPVLSNFLTTAGPAGVAVECFRASLNCAAVAAGDAFVEAEFYPFMGPMFATRTRGDGHDWIASTPVYLGEIVRSGSNYYVYTTAGVTGTTAPSHGSSTVADGTAQALYFGNLAIHPMSRNVPARWHFFNDPSSTYRTGHAHVNATGSNQGSPTAHASYADARAAFLAGHSFGTIKAAGDAIITYNNNGGVAPFHNDAGGGTIWLTNNGTGHAGFGTSMVSYARPSVWLSIKADPAVSGVKFVEGAVKICNSRLWIGDGISFVSATTNILIDPATDATATQAQSVSEVWVNGGTVTGFNSTGEMVARAGAVGYTNLTISGGFVTGNQSNRAHSVLFGGNVVTGAQIIKATNVVGCRLVGTRQIQDARAAGAPAPMAINIIDTALQGLPGTTAGPMINLVTAGANLAVPVFGVNQSGVLGEVCAPPGGDKASQIAADGALAGVIQCVRVACSEVGDRSNGPYNDQGTSNYSTNWYEFNTITTFRNVVFDSSDHAGSGRRGVSCQIYAPVYRVGFTQNLNLLGSQGGIGLNPSTYSGMRDGTNSLFNQFTASTVSAQFVDDRTAMGTGSGTGGGNYRPAAGAAALGMAIRQPRRYALDGVLRRTNGTGAIGVFERTDAETTLTVNAATFSLTAGSSTLTAAAALTPAVVAFGLATAQVALSVTPNVSLAPVAVTLGLLASSPVLGAAASLAAATAQFGLIAQIVGVTIAAPALSFTPANTRGYNLKAAASNIDAAFEYGLEDGEIIFASSWQVRPETPEGLTVAQGSERIVDHVTGCIVTGGVFGRVYELTNAVETSFGRKLIRTTAFRIGPVL
jgi:hypothetical protein